MLSKNFSAFALALLFTLSGCTGWDKAGIVGTFDIRTPFLIKGEPKSLFLRTGVVEARIKYEAGVYGISSPEIIVEYNGKAYGFSVPRKSFSDGQISAKASDIGQDFSFSTSTTNDFIRRYEEDGTHSCTYSGYCLDWGMRMNSKGELENDYYYGYHSSCGGSERVTYVVNEYEEHFRTTFRSPDGALLGTFDGKGKPYQTRDISKYLTSCE